MLGLILITILVSPILVILFKAFVASKDYYEYDKKKSKYILRVTNNK